MQFYARGTQFYYMTQCKLCEAIGLDYFAPSTLLGGNKRLWCAMIYRLYDMLGASSVLPVLLFQLFCLQTATVPFI